MSSSSLWRRASEVELVLDRLEVLGGAGAGVEPGLVAGGPVAHELHVGLGLGDLALHVAELGARAHELVVDEAGLALEVGDLRELGQVAARVGDLVESRVDGLEVEQPQLAGGLGFHGHTSGVGTDHEGPRVGAHCADVGLHPSRALPEGGAQRALGAGQPDLLARPVPGVDEVGRAAAGLLAGLERRVVAQVGGDVDVGPARAHGVEQVVAGAAEHRDATHHGIRRTRDPDAARRRAAGASPAARRRRAATSARARSPTRPAAGPRTRSAASVRVRPQRLRQGLAHPVGRDVGVGVGDVERDVADDEVGDARALGARRRDAVHAAQEQRVVGEEQVGARGRGPPR